MLHAFQPAAAEAGYTMAEYRSDPKKMAKAHLDFARKYGLDGILLDVDTCILADAVGAPIDYPEDAPARRLHGPMAKDFDSLLEALDPAKVKNSPRVAIIQEAVRIMKKEAGGELLIRGNCDQMAFSLAMLVYPNMDDFMADLADEDKEDDLLALLNRTYPIHLAMHEAMIEAGSDLTSFGDSPCGPDLISRAMFEKFALPFHRRLHADLLKKGVKTICHICGNLDKIVEDVAGVGYEGVEIDYKTNIPNAARVFAGKSTVFGPIDPSGVFFFASPERMRQEVKQVLDTFSAVHDGFPAGLVLGAGCALPKGTPPDNIRAFVQAARDYL
jgi:uroporphyrinogen decarboxylase